MAAHKLLILACTIALSGLSAGCIGGFGGDSDTAGAEPSGSRTRASRGILSFGRKKDDTAAKAELARANAAALDGYTPESSMARDMRTLQEQERAQAQLVARLAESRNADPEEFARERERLFALRDKIQNYAAALQRFEMAARTRPERDAEIPPAIVPAEVFADRAVRPASFGGDPYVPYQTSRGEDRLGGYGRSDDNDSVTHARINLNDSLNSGNGYVEEDEKILYTAEGNGNLAAFYENTGALPGMNASSQRNAQAAAQAPMQRQTPAGPMPTRFAGAPVGRSNFSKPKSSQGGKPWESGHLFDAETAKAVEKKKSAVPNIYASRPHREEESFWPEGMAMMPPAEQRQPQTQQQSRALRPAPKTEVRLAALPAELRPAPAAPATLTGSPVSVRAQAQKPAPAAPAVPDDGILDDEVFSPSMFLGSGL